MRKNSFSIGERPAKNAEQWIQRGDRDTPSAAIKSALYTKRLTLDITPHLHGRIKLAAIAAGTTAADLLRDLLEREFPERERDA
jgi:hypothetical protein